MPRYLFQRVVHNDNGWRGPSPGRLRLTGDGKYLEKTGFAHEDWNFMRDACSDGFLHGYMYYRPRDPKGAFNILFATYDKWDGWALIGCYKDAHFAGAGGVLSKEVLKRRAAEVKALEDHGSLGGQYLGKSVSQIMKLLKAEQKYYTWRVLPDGAHAFQSPIRVPKRTTTRFGAYFTRPNELTEQQWDQFFELVGNGAKRAPEDDYKDGGEIEFPEGGKVQRKHIARERNPELVRAAKARFKAMHGRLFCEACEFDFGEAYGRAGIDFIEAHHTVPVSELKDGATTKLDDIVLVCSNCHRILHRRRPWLSMPALKRIVRQMRA